MSKTEIKQRFKENFIRDMQAHLTDLQMQGYVLAEDKIVNNVYLMRFNLNRFKFEVVASLGQAYKHIDISKIRNPFKIVLDNFEVIDIIADAFPMVDSDDLYSYTEYEEKIEDIIPAEEMQADLKNYLKLSKNLAGGINKNIQDTPQAQAQMLAGANVFFTARDNALKLSETNKYFRWNKKADKFEIMTAQDIQSFIADSTGGGEPRKRDIETNMRTVYPMIVPNTSFPVIWNRQKDLQAKIKGHKKGHDKIQKIVDTFG